uniref:Uncharacterized protein n=1 Tax=Neolamprologus brichardi TaxID=32507 RepID=A0A3Q4M9H1_NEOBR
MGNVFHAFSLKPLVQGLSYPSLLVSKKLAFHCLNCVKDDHGHFVIIKGTLLGKEVTFINLYCPPGYSPSFLASTFATFADFTRNLFRILIRNSRINSSSSDKPSILWEMCKAFSWGLIISLCGL